MLADPVLVAAGQELPKDADARRRGKTCSGSPAPAAGRPGWGCAGSCAPWDLARVVTHSGMDRDESVLRCAGCGKGPAALASINATRAFG